MGSTCVKSVDISSHHMLERNLQSGDQSTTNARRVISDNFLLEPLDLTDENDLDLIRKGFFPELSKTEHQQHCQDVFASLEPLKKEADKRRAIASLLSSWKKNGVMQRVHSYINAISTSRPAFEELSDLLVRQSAPYFQGLAKSHYNLIKAYAIYYWVSNNINYNINEWNQMILNQSQPTITPTHVFKRRSSVCSGYANLYSALGLKAGIEVKTVNGHFKRALSEGSGSQDDLFCPGPKNSHAWNAVCIHGVWYLVDCTYGAGVIDGTSFTKMYNDSYFAVPPEHLILTHWPDLSQWQLLEMPLQRNDLKSLIVMTPEACCLGVSLDACEVLCVGSEHTPLVSVQLKAPEYYEVIATLTSWQQDKQSCDQEYDRLVFVNKKDSGTRDIYAVLPNIDNFTLRIFVRDCSLPDTKTTFYTSYLICCGAESNEYVGFPQVFPAIAYRAHFQLLYWTGHLDHVKSHIADCTTGKMAIYFKAQPGTELSHFISPGYFKCEPSAQCYHFYTSLTQDNTDVSLYKLDIVYPLKGLWTVCIMQNDALNDTFGEPLMLYQVNVSKETNRSTYPWIQSPAVSLLHKGTLTTSGKDVFVLPFAIKESIEVHAVLNKTESFNYKDSDQFVTLQQDDNYQKLMVVFPEQGKWTINVFQRPMSSAAQYSNLFSLFFDVESCLQNAIFPAVNTSIATALNVSILDVLPLRYSSSSFNVHLSAPKSICFDVKVTQTHPPHVPTSTIYDYCASLVPFEREGVYCLQAVFLEAGQWTIQTYAAWNRDTDLMQQVYEFKLEIETPITSSHLIFPKLYPTFYVSHISIPCSHVPYEYHVEDKLLFPFILDLDKEPDFIVVVYKDNYPDDKFHLQALIYPDMSESSKYFLEVVFPEEGNWIIQMFTGSTDSRQPILGLYATVKNATNNHLYPWIHPAFFKVYNMNLEPPNFLLLSKVSQYNQFTFTLVRPEDVDILHQARNENDDVIDGVTHLLQTEKCCEYQLSAKFTSRGHWTILLYATRRNHDDWSLVFVHNVTVTN